MTIYTAEYKDCMNAGQLHRNCFKHNIRENPEHNSSVQLVY